MRASMVRLTGLTAAVLSLAAASTGSIAVGAFAAAFALLAVLLVRSPRGMAAEPDDSAACTEDPAVEVRTPPSVDPNAVLMSFFDAVTTRFETLGAHLWLQDRTTGTLRLIEAFGPRIPSDHVLQIEEDETLGRAVTSGEAVLSSIEPGSDLPEGSVLWRYGVPVGTTDLAGVVAVDVLTQGEAPSTHVLNRISSALRGSLSAALAVHEAQVEMDAAALLIDAARTLTSSQNRDDLLRAALDSAMEVAHASTGSVMLPEGADGGLRIAVSRGLPAEIVERTDIQKGEGIAGRVYSLGTPLLTEDLPGLPGGRRHGVRSSVSVPITGPEGSLGVLNVGSRAFPARLTDAYVRALEILGTQTAAAMRDSEGQAASWDGYLGNLQAMVSAVESRDPAREGTSQRTARLASILGETMGVAGDELVALRIAAILHDIGMNLSGPIGVAGKPLSTVERGFLRAHPRVAAEVLSKVPSLEETAPIVRHHHERFDGSGYDTGLAGDSIPLGSRVLAVADAFVAMTSERAERPAFSSEEALKELSAMSGTQFDPEVVETFHRLLTENPDLALSEQ